ncbi:MAG: cobalamin-binding protein [bacterium]|nr:cobalamin-binding protein [bacterium]
MADIPEGSKKTLTQIAECVKIGKADADTNVPIGSQGQPGVAEWVEQAIGEDLPAQTILEQGLMAGMSVMGRKFAANEVFIPEVLIAARAMHAGMAKLKPLFAEDETPSRGVFVIGTVKGDLHDIGKNLVCMLLEGAGWQIVDLGVDCQSDKYVEALEQHPGCVIGLSALLTTTMVAMRDTVKAIRERSPDTVILVGGAPVTDEFAKEIGASAYAPDPSAAIDVLDRLQPAA